MENPNLIFSCELCGLPRQELFSNPALIGDLKEMKAGVALALPMFTAGCARIVQQLNNTGIPVYAWLLVTKEKGNHFHIQHADRAVAQYDSFLAWTNEHDLKWAGIELDLQPGFQGKIFSVKDLSLISSHNLISLPAVNQEKRSKAKQIYRTLVERIQADGYGVSIYQPPIMVDERRAGSNFIQKKLGIIDIKGDREVLILLTNRPYVRGTNPIRSYAYEAEAVAIGQPGKIAAGNGKVLLLSWEAFSRDLAAAARYADTVYIHNLENCYHQGFISKIKNFDWEQPVSASLQKLRKIEMQRKMLQSFLWCTAHPLSLLGGFVGLILLVGLLLRRKK